MTTRSSQQPWFLSTLLGVIVAKGLGRREEPGEAALRSHKGGSVAVSVVVLFQGGFAFFIFFFFSALKAYFMGHFTESMKLISKWVLCAPGLEEAGICFHCTPGAFSPAPTLNGSSSCRSREVFAQPQFIL